jgi:hypothetical protein
VSRTGWPVSRMLISALAETLRPTSCPGTRVAPSHFSRGADFRGALPVRHRPGRARRSPSAPGASRSHP